MSPFDFYFSDPSLSLDSLHFKHSAILTEKESLEILGFVKKPTDLLFEAETAFSIGAYYKKEGEFIFTASPFGAFKLDLPEFIKKNASEFDFDTGCMLDFKCFSASGGQSLWPVKVTNSWAEKSGRPVQKIFMRAKKQDDHCWAPPMMLSQRRASGKVTQYCIMLLPSPPIAIKAIGNEVEIRTEHHDFIIKDPLAVKIVLSGNVRYGYPNTEGVFKLEPDVLP